MSPKTIKATPGIIRVLLFSPTTDSFNNHFLLLYSGDSVIWASYLRQDHNFNQAWFLCNPKYYNLDVIISVGYRVHSKRGTEFRQWATSSRHLMGRQCSG
ncbi:RhuM family protein [Legionella spiritensis]